MVYVIVHRPGQAARSSVRWGLLPRGRWAAGIDRLAAALDGVPEMRTIVDAPLGKERMEEDAERWDGLG